MGLGFIMSKIAISILLLCSTIGCNEINRNIKLDVLLDDLNRPKVIYSYYLNSTGEQVKHGEHLVFKHEMGVTEIKTYNDGEYISGVTQIVDYAKADSKDNKVK